MTEQVADRKLQTLLAARSDQRYWKSIHYKSGIDFRYSRPVLKRDAVPYNSQKHIV